jgi:hypothetical protein
VFEDVHKPIGAAAFLPFIQSTRNGASRSKIIAAVKRGEGFGVTGTGTPEESVSLGRYRTSTRIDAEQCERDELTELHCKSS